MSAGARSRWTNISVGLFVALIVALFAPLVSLVPMAALAALLIVAGFQGMRIPQALTVWNTSRVSGVVMILTFLATLFMPLQYAVLVGVAFSILLYVARQSNKVVLTQIVPVAGRPARGAAGARGAAQPSGDHATDLRQPVLRRGQEPGRDAARTLDDTTHAVVLIGLRGRNEIGSTFVTVLERYAESLKAATAS